MQELVGGGAAEDFVVQRGDVLIQHGVERVRPFLCRRPETRSYNQRTAEYEAPVLVFRVKVGQNYTLKRRMQEG
eukprot:3624887-Pleurochrysis_carterae.AAC.5